MSTGDRQETPVPRVGTLSTEEFTREFLARGQPVVIENGAAEWKAFTTWSPEHLAQVLAQRRVKVASSEKDVFGYDEAEAAYDVVDLGFPEAAELITRQRPSTRRYYLMQQSIPKEFPELLPDVPAPGLVGEARVHPHLWFGSEGNLTPLHYDMANNLFAQLRGHKRFLLFDPSQSARLYPRPADSKHHNLSQLDPETADLERFPDFRDAEPRQCVVGPGDLLFLPAFWWHQVRSLEVGLSVSVWWGPRPEQFLTPMARRMVPVLYQRDRLLTLKTMVSERGEYQGFLGMARFMDRHQEPALATLFAAAAAEETLRLLYLRAVKPPNPAALRDLKLMTEALAGACALTAEETETLRQCGRLVDRALGRLEGTWEAGETEAVIAAVVAFVDRHLPRLPKRGDQSTIRSRR